MSMNWRLASRLSVITMAILVILLVTFFERNRAGVANHTNSASQSGLQGTDLGGTTAQDFRLTDQLGRLVTLSQFKGQPVALTFLYTNCPDQCPLTAEKMHTAMQNLGSDAQHVAMLAVSTDPQRDTAAAALKFSQMHNMQDYWHYLVGTRETLSPIWSSYGIYAQQQQQMVNHSQGLFIIDKQGHQRVFLGNDFTPTQLSSDLSLLLKE